ncbi:MAG TPA: hypothetical protein VMR02_09050 [Terracidiphilus sp.]|jgi:hypothetical protein|nr:hypothetical protein [Terracidiphilus sp.]
MPETGFPISVNINFKNMGKSAAFRLTLHRHILMGGEEAEEFRADSPPGATGSAVLEPDMSQFTSAASLRDTFAKETILIDPKDLVPWAGQKDVLIFGSFYYLDIFGTLYCTLMPKTGAQSPINFMTLPTSAHPITRNTK